ncbi:MAG: ABC transporter substrate-binding protein [Phascolarctobacterium sp.]|uniref:ABC transporter substrate-binding protein n=1 Tax=Phascolarctobacterium sp. TaxID=2049039 RepID=UPI0026DC1475|nr:ABC transporter substrate-binding protein [Phascolarctobacterium sp.]MDO4920561.1 ABC transporter substrate-binding protein [Phascolarctobacterium sp.]
MKLKKILAVGMISLLAAAALTGCGGEKKNADSGKKVQIEYWHVAAESFGGATVKELVADFNKTHPNIEVVEKYNPDMYKGLTQNLQAAMASGKNPDVVQMGYSFLNYAAENLKYTDLNVAFKEAGDANFMQDNFLPNVLKLAQTEDGKQIGLPYSVSVPVLFYNPEIFQKAGLDANKPPQTWDEVMAAAKQIKEKTGNMGFFMQEYADNWTQQGLIESNGGQMLKKVNGKTVAGFDTPEAAQAYQMLADMVKDGSGLHATNEEGFQAYLSGKLGMVCTTIGKRANFEKAAKFNVKAAPFPAFNGKEVKIPAGGNFLMVFSKDAAKQKAAVEFIKYLESPAALAKWSTGTGYLPPRKGVADDPQGFKKLADENPNIKMALEQMAKVTKWASFPGANGLQAEQLLIDARDIILSGKMTAADALHQTAEKINKLL